MRDVIVILIFVRFFILIFQRNIVVLEGCFFLLKKAFARGSGGECDVHKLGREF